MRQLCRLPRRSSPNHTATSTPSRAPAEILIRYPLTWDELSPVDWNHGRPTYRCRHGHTSTQRANQQRPKTLYIREDRLIDQINIRLGYQGHDGHATPESDWTRSSSRVAVALRDSGRFVVRDSAGWRLQEIDSS
ncbi:hypothetical protein ACIOD2_46715 [Amycolatopsis sp. NPDC088138]|uniref:hypothetical protein n=1 Tax=Amycolatopsis sp. NPDC088138 TaxID=3363938 RepID=UPI0037FEB780